MRKVVRGDETSSSYARKIQPMPKLGPWVPEAWKAELGADWAQVWHTWRHIRDLACELRLQRGFAALRHAGEIEGLEPLARVFSHIVRSLDFPG